MGCTQSKIENEEAVARCKERKQYMKEAVTARNAFAAAHTSYATYLKNTGAALSDFIHGEVQNPQSASGSAALPSHMDHSARVMRVITFNRSFKGMPNLLDDGKDDFDYDENETHATILDKLLAWEKKL
ncbi:hypothetical protein K1719_021252 [Acacia pycnantha]|nr:hypothetical protein K1719_021252 [Acacia pycnantha]